MIKLTSALDNHPILVNPEDISLVSDVNAKTKITVLGYEDPVYVKESIEEVARMLLEYRLEIERYKAAVKVGIEQDNLSGRQIAEISMDILREFAGLEMV